MVINTMKRLMKNELFVSSLTLLILINIGNFINYLYQFTMARMLGPVDYGTLAVLISITYIFAVPVLSIQTVVSKHSTRLNSSGELGKIKGMLNYLLKRLLFIAFITFMAFLVLSIFLSEYLNISFWLLGLTGTFLFIGFTYPIGIGILQGMKKFKVWGWNTIIYSLAKIILAVILVVIGFGVYGAILGFIFGAFIAFLFIFPFIKEVTNSNEIKEKVGIFSKDSLPIFLAILLIVLMYSIDVILAKGLFDPEIAGKYAVISMIGKIILFGTMAIGSAMFPISSERFFNGVGHKGVIRKTSIIMVLLCGFAIILFWLFPEFVINILFGSQYLSMANILVYVGIAFSFISFLNILILYRISVDEFKIIHIVILMMFLSIQIIALSVFNDSVKNFSIAFMSSTILTFLGSFVLIRK